MKCNRPLWCRWLRHGVFLTLAWLASGLARAQTPQATGPQATGPQATEPTTQGQPYTLHVYEDLIEIPTLALDRYGRSYSGLQPNGFRIQLDQGTAFAPQHVRAEGNDPLNLFFLLDFRRGEGQGDLVRALDIAASHMPEDVLNRADRISIFAFDCSLVRSLYGAPGSRSVLQAGFSALIDVKTLRDRRRVGGCKQPLQLWDATGAAISQVSALPGRRVGILLTNGIDRGSAHPWQDVRQFANGYSTTIFGLLADAGIPPPATQTGSLGHGSALPIMLQANPFSLLCNGTGGLVLLSSEVTRGPLILRIVELLRQRYILDFPRPRNDSVGVHELTVTLKADKHALVRAGGVLVPMRKQDPVAAPDTLPVASGTSPGQVPEMGKGRSPEP